jgi:signal transduction histidine kinase/ligand-binding sensor domain-containing protein
LVAGGCGLLLTGSVAWAQEPPAAADYFSRRWQVDDGLPHNVVNRIVQDRRGFLWLASKAGLARFDGREFKEFPLPMAAREGNYNIRALAVEDDRTLVMLPASGGVVRLRDGIFSFHPASAALGGKSLLDLFAEPDGTLWIVTDDPLLFRWQKGRIQTLGRETGVAGRRNQYSFADDGHGSLWIAVRQFLGQYREGNLIPWAEPVGSALSIAPARSGGFWLSTPERLLKRENDRLVAVPTAPEWPSVEQYGIQQLFEDRSGVLWIATRRHGLYRLAAGQLARLPDEHNIVSSVTEDAEDNVWVATSGGGISRLRPKAYVLLDAAAGLPDSVSSSVCSDATGALWCANRSGGLVHCQAGQTHRFARANGNPIYANAVCPDGEGQIWVGASDGVYRLSARTPTTLQTVTRALSDVHVLFCSSRGDVWVGSGDNRLGFFRQGSYRALAETDGYSLLRVRAIAEGPAASVWIATEGQNLYEFVDNKLVLRLPKEKFLGGLLHTLHFDHRGSLWIGTTNGLVLRQGTGLTRIGSSEGLPDDNVSQILEDDNGRLWCASRRGLFVVALADLYAFAEGRLPRVSGTTFGKDEGLFGATALDGTQPIAWKTRDGRLWFSTHQGLVGIDPAATLPARLPPPVYIDEILLDHRPVAATAGVLRIPAGDHEIRFAFAALNYSAPEKVQMRHQLVGFDLGWAETGSDRSVSYVRLPPGKYTLRAIACNQDGAWNETGGALALVVVPTWWQSGWFRGALLFVFVGVVGWVVRFWSHRRLKRRLQRLEHEHALEQERSRIARDLHDELGGSLTRIGMLADRLKRHTPDTGLKEALGQLASHTRTLAGDLESVVWTVSPKNNSWDRLAAFIGRFALSFFRDTPIECCVDGSERIPAAWLSPEAQHHTLAVLKETLNNILKHARASRVTIAMAWEQSRFTLEISDNGVGFDPAAQELSERNGLRNMHDRVRELGGELAIVSSAAQGTTLTIWLPVAVHPAAVR